VYYGRIVVVEAVAITQVDDEHTSCGYYKLLLPESAKRHLPVTNLKGLVSRSSSSDMLGDILRILRLESKWRVTKSYEGVE
jgi:hypothetical protein